VASCGFRDGVDAAEARACFHDDAAGARDAIAPGFFRRGVDVHGLDPHARLRAANAASRSCAAGSAAAQLLHDDVGRETLDERYRLGAARVLRRLRPVERHGAQARQRVDEHEDGRQQQRRERGVEGEDAARVAEPLAARPSSWPPRRPSARSTRPCRGRRRHAPSQRERGPQTAATTMRAPGRNANLLMTVCTAARPPPAGPGTDHRDVRGEVDDVGDRDDAARRVQVAGVEGERAEQPHPDRVARGPPVVSMNWSVTIRGRRCRSRRRGGSRTTTTRRAPARSVPRRAGAGRGGRWR